MSEPDSLCPLMDAQVPAVVAVVVTTDPGPWFEEALSSLAAQDYEELSVLVLSTGDDAAGVTERVGRILPDAFVRHLPDRPGYAAASNEALGDGRGRRLLPALPRRRGARPRLPSTSWSRSPSAPTPASSPRSSSTGTTPASSCTSG